MKDRLLVNVTQGHIDHGVINSYTACPIALAIWGNGENYDDVCVSNAGIETRDLDGREVWYYHTLSSIDFVKRFDAGEIVSPCRFILEGTRSSWSQSGER